MATLSIPQLSIDLPSSRMSVNFDTFDTAIRQPSTTRNRHELARKPLPGPRGRYPHPAKPTPSSLPGIQEEKRGYQTPSRHDSANDSLQNDKLLRSIQTVYSVSRTNSSASSASSSSSSSAGDSILSRAQTASSSRTSSPSSLRSTKPLPTHSNGTFRLMDLPQSLIEQTLTYVLPVGTMVAIGPNSLEQRHMQYRYHRASLDYVGLRQALQHPIFLVSRQLRADALDVFYQKCDFSIDLASIYYTQVSSTADENLKKQQRFWNLNVPLSIRRSLQRMAKLNLRVPVPSSEAAQKGREEDDWMDGSDGKGGGGWRIKSLKREQDDAAEIQKCLEAIVRLLLTPLEPEENRSVGRSFSLRRKGSVKSRTATPVTDHEDDKRRQLKRLELTLVKRSPFAMVLPEALGLIRALRTIPVTGFTKYHFELEGQKFLWAAKFRKKWRGKEPNGQDLLKDLQGLTVAPKPIEPIVTPTTFHFIEVGKDGRLQLADNAVPKTPITFEGMDINGDENVGQSSGTNNSRYRFKKPLAIFTKRSHRRIDSYTLIMKEGMGELDSNGKPKPGRNQPPSIDELKKIAEDIRNGVI